MVCRSGCDCRRAGLASVTIEAITDTRYVCRTIKTLTSQCIWARSFACVLMSTTPSLNQLSRSREQTERTLFRNLEASWQHELIAYVANLCTIEGKPLWKVCLPQSASLQGGSLQLYSMQVSMIMQPAGATARHSPVCSVPRAFTGCRAGPSTLSQFQGFRRTNLVDGLGRHGPAVSWEAAVGRSLRRPRSSAKAVRVTKMMFERFTEKAIKVVMLAQEEARRLGHNFVGTEQVLLGLIGESTGIAAKVLKSMGVTLKDARVEVEKIIGRGSGFVAVEIPFTPRAKRVLELSLEEARQLGQFSHRQSR